MSGTMQVLNTTINGKIYWCKNSEIAQVLFKNLCSDFTLKSTMLF